MQGLGLFEWRRDLVLGFASFVGFFFLFLSLKMVLFMRKIGEEASVLGEDEGV